MKAAAKPKRAPRPKSVQVHDLCRKMSGDQLFEAGRYLAVHYPLGATELMNGFRSAHDPSRSVYDAAGKDERA
jgi:hypothetical protein